MCHMVLSSLYDIILMTLHHFNDITHFLMIGTRLLSSPALSPRGEGEALRPSPLSQWCHTCLNSYNRVIHHNNKLLTSFLVLNVSVPDPKPTPAWIAFSIARGEYWKRYMRRMRSGDETILVLKYVWRKNTESNYFYRIFPGGDGGGMYMHVKGAWMRWCTR